MKEKEKFSDEVMQSISRSESDDWCRHVGAGSRADEEVMGRLGI